MEPWHNLTPKEFEQFCYHLLEFNDFKNLTWLGSGGSDKGRDIMATKPEEPLAGRPVNRKWLIQCKHYRKAKLSKGQLTEWLAACREHRPDRVLLVTSKSPNAALLDWIESIRSDYPFELHIWDEMELRQQFRRHAAKLVAHFPQLPRTGSTELIYAMHTSEYHIGIGGLDEVYLMVFNTDSEEKALQRAKEAIDYIKANDFKIYRDRQKKDKAP